MAASNGGSASAGPLGASREVIAHAAAQHPCDADAASVPCPCGDCVAVVCTSCGEPVFVAIRAGTCCEHARDLIARST
jgi:hypothetical protein